MARSAKRNCGRPNDYILIILDSCRYDSFVSARPRVMSRLGKVEARWSYASWTAPSLYNFLMGLMPHVSPKRTFASDYYKEDFARYSERLGVAGIRWESLVPKLNLPYFLQTSLNYRTHAMVSLPVVNPSTLLNNGFDTFRLMDKHNDMRAMLKVLKFSAAQPSFYLLNVGETHYPYSRPDESPDPWPRLHGVHGVFKHLDDPSADRRTAQGGRSFFTPSQMKFLRRRQIEAVAYLDGVMEELFALVPESTYITITADHGELFGEQGYFGHGPINHPKVFEVPFVEGRPR